MQDSTVFFLLLQALLLGKQRATTSRAAMSAETGKLPLNLKPQKALVLHV